MFKPTFTIVIILLIFCTGCTSIRIQPYAGGNSEFISKMNNFHLIETENGKKIIEVMSKEAKFDKSMENAEMIDVKMLTYNETERINSNLKGDTAYINLLTHDMEVNGNVVVVSDKDTILNADNLIWLYSKNMIKTDGRVKIRKGGNILSGIGFISDDKLESITIHKVDAKVSDIENEKKKK